MPVRIDHVITGARNLDALEAAFRRLGFTVVGGGEHPHLGTRNRLIVFGNGYLELLTIANPSAASPALEGRFEHGDGWVGLALQSEDVDAEALAMRERGVDVRGPKPGRLRALDGVTRTWRTVGIGTDDLWASAVGLQPFIIQHDTSGERHARELAHPDEPQPHPNGAISLVEATFAVDDLHGASLRFASVYGLRPSGTASLDESLGAEVVSIPLDGGAERIVLAHPVDDGIAQRRLDAAGEGLCRVTLGVRDAEATRAYLQRTAVAFESRGAETLIPPEETMGAPLLLTEAR